LSGSRDIVKRFIGIVIAILLLGYGVVRMGVGALLLAQTLDIVNFPDLAEANAEVKIFIDARANYQILPFSLNGYHGYILAMGVCYRLGLEELLLALNGDSKLLVFTWLCTLLSLLIFKRLIQSY
jgi:hypothetical protein